MSTLEKAIALAAISHAGQTDKAGVPYILHPLRVMLRLKTPEEMMAGVLHDVVEDCGVTYDQLRQEGFPESVIEAIRSVTKVEDEDYEEFVRRAAQHPIGKAVKLADLADNCDLSRISNPTEKDVSRVEKYRNAIAVINDF